MKKLGILSFILICLSSFLFFSTYDGKVSSELISPLFKKEKVLGLNQWFPKKAEAENQLDSPQITARAALFMDTNTGEILYSKNIHEKLPVASLVKVMTVLIALENKGMDEKYMVSQRASEMEPDEMILFAGETLKLRELLYGIFLISANDAAEVLAEGTTGNRGEFIKMMNDKAKQLGMGDSYFANPTGLDEDLGSSYSSAYDLAILSRYLIKNFPEVVEISRTEHVIFPRSSTHQDYEMYSGINLLTTYPGVVGFKTGYTPEAGLTLITLVQKDGHEVIGILLGSENRRDELERGRVRFRVWLEERGIIFESDVKFFELVTVDRISELLQNGHWLNQLFGMEQELNSWYDDQVIRLVEQQQNYNGQIYRIPVKDVISPAAKLVASRKMRLAAVRMRNTNTLNQRINQLRTLGLAKIEQL